MDWSELETERGAAGHVVVNDKLREFDPRAKAFVDTPIKVRIPRPHDLLQARIDARAMFVQLKLDAEKDRDLFDETEQLCLLAKCVRDPKTEAQFCDVDELPKRFDEGTLQDLLGRIRVYRDMLDPRERLTTEEDVYRKIAEVARTGQCLPLVAIAGFEQPSFIVTMAELAATSPTLLAWLRSSATSTPEPSKAAT